METFSTIQNYGQGRIYALEKFKTDRFESKFRSNKKQAR